MRWNIIRLANNWLRLTSRNPAFRVTPAFLDDNEMLSRIHAGDWL